MDDGVAVVIPVVRIDFGMDKLLVLPILPLALTDDVVTIKTNRSIVSDDRRLNRCTRLNEEALVVDSVRDKEGIETKRSCCCRKKTVLGCWIVPCHNK